MARLHCSKGNYYTRFHDKTKSPARKTAPLRTRDEAAALAALRRLEVHYAEGRFDPWAPPEDPPARLSDAVAAFFEAKAHRAPATLRLYHTVLDGLLGHAGDRLLRDVAPRDVLAFLRPGTSTTPAGRRTSSGSRRSSAGPASRGWWTSS